MTVGEGGGVPRQWMGPGELGLLGLHDRNLHYALCLIVLPQLTRNIVLTFKIQVTLRLRSYRMCPTTRCYGVLDLKQSINQSIKLRVS